MIKFMMGIRSTLRSLQVVKYPEIEISLNTDRRLSLFKGLRTFSVGASPQRHLDFFFSKLQRTIWVDDM